MKHVIPESFHSEIFRVRCFGHLCEVSANNKGRYTHHRGGRVSFEAGGGKVKPWVWNNLWTRVGNGGWMIEGFQTTCCVGESVVTRQMAELFSTQGLWRCKGITSLVASRVWMREDLNAPEKSWAPNYCTSAYVWPTYNKSLPLNIWTDMHLKQFYWSWLGIFIFCIAQARIRVAGAHYDLWTTPSTSVILQVIYFSIVSFNILTLFIYAALYC